MYLRDQAFECFNFISFWPTTIFLSLCFWSTIEGQIELYSGCFPSSCSALVQTGPYLSVVQTGRGLPGGTVPHPELFWDQMASASLQGLLGRFRFRSLGANWFDRLPLVSFGQLWVTFFGKEVLCQQGQATREAAITSWRKFRQTISPAASSGSLRAPRDGCLPNTEHLVPKSVKIVSIKSWLFLPLTYTAVKESIRNTRALIVMNFPPAPEMKQCASGFREYYCFCCFCRQKDAQRHR